MTTARVYHHDHDVPTPCSDTCPVQADHGTPEWERRMLASEWPKRAHDEVYPGLWIGGSWRGAPAAGEFDTVLTLCGSYEATPVPRGTRHVHVPLRDREDGIPDPQQLAELVAKVVEWVRSDQRVLVRCYAGLNRSGLIVGLALCELTGLPGELMISAMRAHRDEKVLCNPAFAAYVAAVPGTRTAGGRVE